MPYYWAYIPWLLIYLVFVCIFSSFARWREWNKIIVRYGQGFIFLLLIGGVLYEVFANQKHYIPKYVKEHLVDLIEDVKEVKVPFSSWGFNPAVIPYGDQYLMIFRAEKRRFEKTRIKKYPYLLMGFLTKEFDLSGELIQLQPSLTEKNRCYAPEDPRMFIHNEKIYVCYNDCNEKDVGKSLVPRQMHLGEIVHEENGWRLKNILPLTFQRPLILEKAFSVNVEKNWSPFLYEDEIHFIYSYDPLIVIKPDLKTGECTEVSRSKQEFFSNISRGARGGTPLCRTEEGFLTFYHICNRERPVKKYSPFFSSGIGGYFIGAFEISQTPPFKILRETGRYLSGKGLYKGKKKIEYPSALIVEKDRLILFFGREDKKIMVGIIDRKKLEETMISVHP